MKHRSSIIFGIVFATSLAYAGQEVGNGGGAFVCRDQTGNVLSAELVDLYEAKNQLGLKIRGFGSMSVEERIELMQLKAYQAKRADTNFGALLDQGLSQVRTIIRFVDEVVLEETNDFQISISPKSCTGGTVHFEQLASYTPTGELIVNSEIYEKLDDTNKAGLYMHEALYLIARMKHGSESSLEARRANGYLMSRTEAGQIPSGVLTMQPAAGIPNKRWKCATTLLEVRCTDPVYGCHDSNHVRVVNTFGKSKVDASAQFQQYLTGDVLACNSYSSQYARNSDYHYRTYVCNQVASVDTSCFQQF